MTESPGRPLGGLCPHKGLMRTRTVRWRVLAHMAPHTKGQWHGSERKGNCTSGATVLHG